VVTLDHCPATLRKTVLTPDVLMRPHRNGQVVLAGDDHGVNLTSDSPPAQRTAAAHELLKRAKRLVPDLAQACLADVVVGIRPLPSDGVSVVGHLEPYRNLYVAVTHSGVTLAALLGELCTRELVGGSPSAQLDSFRPARFAAPTDLATAPAVNQNAEVGK
jgi:glycine/D-amino acid oxidase-like deaminating enzyme